MERNSSGVIDFGITLRTRIILLAASSILAILLIIALGALTLGDLHLVAGVRSKTSIILIITAFMVFLIIALAIHTVRSVVNPIRKCIDFSGQLAAGSLQNRLDIKCSGEVNELVTAMNAMAENLQRIVLHISGTTDELKRIDQTITRAATQVVSATTLQEEAVNESNKAVSLINNSVVNISEGVDQLAASAGETSSSILEMAASIEEVAINTDTLATSVDEVSSSVVQMAASIKGIGSSIINLLEASSTTASSIAEMDANIRQVEKNAADTSFISETTRTDAEDGLVSVQETIAGMQDIRKASRITAEVVEHLSLRVGDIGTILSVIDEVAEQTNLLALNAAIIAAQAGDQGKGFAVVADEIKELAERTSSSTREIAQVINAVQEETGRAVAAINQAELAISTGEELSERSGAVLEKIVAGVQQAGVQISSIARATVEQAKGSQSIRIAMEQVEEMVEQIANSAKEHGRGSDMITSAAERMREMTNQVRGSTREQSRASSLIAKSTENITNMIDRIREACADQEMQGKAVERTVSNLRLSSSAASQVVRSMNNAVTSLALQIERLENEMDGFK